MEKGGGELRETEKEDCIGFECLGPSWKSWAQLGEGEGREREGGCLGQVMAIDSKGRVTALRWPLRKSTSMNDECPGSVTHGAVLPVPALT